VSRRIRSHMHAHFDEDVQNSFARALLVDAEANAFANNDTYNNDTSCMYTRCMFIRIHYTRKYIMYYIPHYLFANMVLSDVAYGGTFDRRLADDLLSALAIST